MKPEYPVDVAQLVGCLDADTRAHIHLGQAERDDQRLTAVVWGVGHGWFPLDSQRRPHLAVDIGVPSKSGTGGMYQAPVKAIADGEVLHCALGAYSPRERFCMGRAIIKHTIDGAVLYGLYQHIDPMDLHVGRKVKTGQVIGTVGWHGDFPHLHFSLISPQELGGNETQPAAEEDALPKDDSVWDVLRVGQRVPNFDEWPFGPKAERAFVYNPIELIRVLRKEDYAQDVGGNRANRIALANESRKVDLQAGAHAEIEHPVLHSTRLAKVAELIAAASDEQAFAGIGKGQGGEEAVKAIVEVLRDLKMPHGKPGETRPGKFDKWVAYGVKTFQDTLFKKEKAAFLDAHGVDKAHLDKLKQKDNQGKVEWVTLMALDACHAVLEAQQAAKKRPQASPSPAAQPASEPASQPAGESQADAADDDDAGESSEAPAAMPAPPPPQAQPAAAAATGVFPDGDPWIFDGESGKLSIAFGLRIYQALREFSLHEEGGVVKGTRYSTNASPELIEIYQSALQERLQPETNARFTEWPDLSAFPFLTAVDTSKPKYKTYKAAAPVHRVFGMTWAATGFTNCCNSQLAAFYVAARGLTVNVHRGGKTVTHWLGDEDAQHKDVLRNVLKDSSPWKYWDDGESGAGEPSMTKRASFLFEAAVALSPALAPYDEARGGAYNAVRALGIGDAIPMKDKQYQGEFALAQDLLREAFIGDWGNFTAHSWLVGEIRYQVTLDDGKKLSCDQSSFADPSWEAPILMVEAPKGRMVPKERMLTDDQLKWIVDHEDDFTGRVRKLLAGGKQTVVIVDKNGAKTKAEKTVQQVKVVSFGAFTSNPTWAKGFGGKKDGEQLSITLSGRHCWLKDEHQQKFAQALKDRTDLDKQVKKLKKKKKPSDDEAKELKDLEEKLEKAKKDYADAAFPRAHWEVEAASVKDTVGMVDRGISNALDGVKPSTSVSLSRFYARKK